MTQSDEELSRPNEDPMWQKWLEKASEIYKKIYYDSNQVVAAIIKSEHRVVEKNP